MIYSPPPAVIIEQPVERNSAASDDESLGQQIERVIADHRAQEEAERAAEQAAREAERENAMKFAPVFSSDLHQRPPVAPENPFKPTHEMRSAGERGPLAAYDQIEPVGVTYSSAPPPEHKENWIIPFLAAIFAAGWIALIVRLRAKSPRE